MVTSPLPSAWVPAGAHGTTVGAGPGRRHPLDPEPVPSSKAAAVLVLGITAVALALCGGGWVPAVIGLLLAGPAEAELRTAEGWLTGAGRLRAGRWMCLIALVVTAVAVAGLLAGWIVYWGTGDNAPAYGSDVD